MSSSDLKFYTVGKKGTVLKTVNYNPEKAVETLYESMKGLGTDEDAIIDVVATHTFDQRQELKQLYKHKYGKDLIKELDSELSFSFSKTVLALMKRPEQFIIECIHQAISVRHKSRAARLLKQLQKIYKKGLGSDEYSLIALLCPRTNEQLEAIKILYKKEYQKEMEEDLGFDLGDDLRSLITDMISGDREGDEEGVDADKVLEDADNLFAARYVPSGEIYGTKERVLQQILNTRSYEHLRRMIPAYEEVSNKGIEEYIEHTDLNVDLKEAYLIIVKILRNEPEYYAERLRDSIQGLGTDDDMLISIIVLRSEIDLREIMHIYENKFGVSLQDDVTGDTSGDYRHILLKILNLPEEVQGLVVNENENEVEGEEEEADEITITPAVDDEEDEVEPPIESAEEPEVQETPPCEDEVVAEEEEIPPCNAESESSDQPETSECNGEENEEVVEEAPTEEEPKACPAEKDVDVEEDVGGDGIVTGG